MKLENKHIIQDDMLAKSELQDFLDGKLMGDELTKVEKKISGNEFYKDAIEGFQSVPGAINTLNEVPSNYNINRFKLWNSQNFFFATIIPSLVVILFVLTSDILPKKTNEIKPDENKISELVLSEENVTIEDAKIIPENKQIDYTKTIKAQPKTIEKISEENLEYIQSLSPHKAIEINVPNILNEDVVKSNIYTYSNFPIYYIIDLKTVDYRMVYINKLNEDENNLGGLESKYESEDSEKYNIHELTKISYQYENFLQNALAKFKKNNFKEALYDFNLILEQFPEDLNAFFYGGLCYYNIGIYSKALENFDFVIKHYITSFDQEAEWYKAKTLISMNRIIESKTLLELIIDKDGFYKNDAKQLLKMN